MLIVNLAFREHGSSALDLVVSLVILTLWALRTRLDLVVRLVHRFIHSHVFTLLFHRKVLRRALMRIACSVQRLLDFEIVVARAGYCDFAVVVPGMVMLSLILQWLPCVSQGQEHIRASHRTMGAFKQCF